MEKHQEVTLSNHVDGLSSDDKKAWKAQATQAINNLDDPNHASWDWIASVAKWLGMPVPSANVTKPASLAGDVTALGTTWFGLKKVAIYLKNI